MNKKAKLRNVSIILAVLIVVLAALAYYFLAVQKIEDIKTSEKVGESVRVRGEVDSVVKIGGLSGYMLSDDSGSIAVSSQKLPQEGETVMVRGVLIKDMILGYYIKVG